MAVSWNSLMMTLNENVGTSLLYFKYTENNDWEIMKSKNNKLKVVINGQLLFS